MQISVHNPTRAVVWLPDHRDYGALEIHDEAGNRTSVFVNKDDAEFLQSVILSASKALAALSE